MKPSDQARWQGTVDSWLAQGWASEGKLTNPAANALWADTGQLLAGWYDFTIIFAVNNVYPLYVTVEHRNAANDGNIGSQDMAFLANTSFTFNISNYRIAVNERLRIRDNAGGATLVMGSIIYSQRA